MERGSYPELHVDGKPFFIYSAEFLYPRVPRSLWETSLDRYRDLGINTITISIPWNWHEPREGAFDFDGHTNPRRDLRALLRLISGRGLKLIARPGPAVLREWRNRGYPDWLLERPEYQMPLADRLEGRAPPAAELEAENAEAAARLWLENPSYMAHAEVWFKAVAHELAPYRSTLAVPAASGGPAKGKKQGAPPEASGPLLFVQVGDGLGSGPGNPAGAEFWRYVETLCSFLSRGGLDTPCLINPGQPRAAGAGSAQSPPVASFGQWFAAPASDRPATGEPLGPAEVSSLALAAASLATQPAFPPILAGFNTGTFAPEDDERPAPGFPQDSSVAGHLLIGYGVHGLSWFPLQDTLTPAGYSSPVANRFYRWDAPLSLGGERQPGVREVEHIGNWLSVWGSWVAASHPRADFGLVDALAALPRENLTKADASAVIGTLEQVQRLAQYAGLSAELTDPEFQPAAQLLRHALLLMPVYKPGDPAYALSEEAQRALADYVRGGGVLVCFPGAPSGAVLGALEQGKEAESTRLPAGTREWRAGSGRFVVLTKDFYSWISPGEDFADGQERFPAPFARSLVRELLAEAGVRPSIRRAEHGAPSPDLIATELISNGGTLPLGKRSGGEAWLSAVNLSYDAAISETIEVLSPRSSAREERSAPADWISMPIRVPPRESLMLPVELSLCLVAEAREDCSDRIISSTAELVRAERDGKAMILTLYAPVRATVRLHLAEEPDHVEVDDAPADAHWTKSDHELQVEILRGASPKFLRVLRVPLSYRPELPAAPKEDWGHRTPAHFHFSPAGAVRLPLGLDASLLTNPPLFVLERGSDGTLGVVAENVGEQGDVVEAEATGQFNASARALVAGGELRILRLKLKAAAVDKAASEPPGPDGLYHGKLHFSDGHESGELPAAYAIIPAEGAAGYRFDFDADGNAEQVLENSALRAIFSPAAGGRLIALFLKAPGQNLASTMGLLEDAFSFTPNPPGTPQGDAQGISGTYNRSYAADWLNGDGGPSLHLAYEAPDVYPHGAWIEKTARLSGERGLAVEYRVSLPPADAARLEQEAASRIFAAPAPVQPAAQSFEILNSIPADAAEASGTQFCWAPPAAGTADAAGSERCESFVRGGAAIPVPAGVRSVEIRRPRHAGLAVAWGDSGARVTLEPKNYSVLLRMAFPPLSRGGEAGAYRIEFTVKEGQ